MLGGIHQYELQIREGHLDSFGHVNNAAYLDILEEARWELVTANGYGLQEVHHRGIGPVVLEVHLRFMREIRNRQRVVVRTWLHSYTGKIGRLAQQICDESGQLCTDALFSIGLFDLRTRKLIRPTPEWVTALGLRLEDLG